MKIKNICIYIIFAIIIFSVFKLPETMLMAEENKIEKKSYEKQEKQSKIDVEIEKIYLVKAIHDMQTIKSIAISPNDNSTKDIYQYSDELYKIQDKFNNQIKRLGDYNILKNINLEINKTGIAFLFKTYQNDENKYIINNINLKINNKDYNIEMENKTNKIIYILFNKEDMCEISHKEILENYIKYLDLYIIDDWEYVEDKEDITYSLISKKFSFSSFGWFK